jgi:hypothetical protein
MSGYTLISTPCSHLVRIQDRRMVSLKLMQCTDMTVTNCVRALAPITSLEPYDEEFALEWLATALEEILGLTAGFTRARSSMRIDTSYSSPRSLAGPDGWHPKTSKQSKQDGAKSARRKKQKSENFAYAQPKAHTPPRRASRASEPFAAPSSASTARPTSAPPSPTHVAPQELALHAELAALKRASKDAYSLLTHIYAKHPPRTKPHVVPAEVRAVNIKKSLLNALRDYHPDHNRPMGDDWWYVLCCEITKALNERHAVLRHV